MEGGELRFSPSAALRKPVRRRQRQATVSGAAPTPNAELSADTRPEDIALEPVANTVSINGPEWPRK